MTKVRNGWVTKYYSNTSTVTNGWECSLLSYLFFTLIHSGLLFFASPKAVSHYRQGGAYSTWQAKVLIKLTNIVPLCFYPIFFLYTSSLWSTLSPSPQAVSHYRQGGAWYVAGGGTDKRNRALPSNILPLSLTSIAS